METLGPNLVWAIILFLIPLKSPPQTHSYYGKLWPSPSSMGINSTVISPAKPLVTQVCFIERSTKWIYYWRRRWNNSGSFVEFVCYCVAMNPQFEQWVTTYLLLLSWLYNSMTLEVAIQHMCFTNSKDMWEATQDLFGVQSRLEEGFL